MSEWKLMKDRDGWYISPIGALIPFTDTKGLNADRQETAAKVMNAAPKLYELAEAVSAGPVAMLGGNTPEQLAEWASRIRNMAGAVLLQAKGGAK